jgi:hypothetical protein
MIKRILIVLNLFLLSQFNSQVKMELNLDTNNKKAYVGLINTSNDNLIIPIDILSLRPYFDDICLDIAQHTFEYPTLGLNIKVMRNNKVVESLGGTGKMNDLNVINKINLEKKKHEKKIKLWQKKNGIKSFDDAKINYYIFNNLVYLKPGEKIEKVFYFDLHNITNGKYIYYYYHIEDDKQYDVSLSFNISKCVYTYLTTSQKEKLKRYQFFTGSLESNKIELNLNNLSNL